MATQATTQAHNHKSSSILPPAAMLATTPNAELEKENIICGPQDKKQQGATGAAAAKQMKQVGFSLTMSHLSSCSYSKSKYSRA